jgi:hypothetical protein
LCKGLQEEAKKERYFHSKFRAGDESWVCVYDTGIKQQSSHWKSHLRELRPMKSDFWSMLSAFLNSEAILQKEFFSSVPDCESAVLHWSTKGFYGSCWEKMPNKWHTQDWLLHRDNTPCHTDSWLFPVPNQKKMVVVSGLFTSQSYSSWLILVLKDRNMVKGMKIQGYHENKPESQAALERNAIYVFQRCFLLGETLGDVFKLRRGSLTVTDVSLKVLHSLSLETFDWHLAIYSHFTV